jgi:hypothetical protein
MSESDPSVCFRGIALTQNGAVLVKRLLYLMRQHHLTLVPGMKV